MAERCNRFSTSSGRSRSSSCLHCAASFFVVFRLSFKPALVDSLWSNGVRVPDEICAAQAVQRVGNIFNNCGRNVTKNESAGARCEAPRFRSTACSQQERCSSLPTLGAFLFTGAAKSVGDYGRLFNLVISLPLDERQPSEASTPGRFNRPRSSSPGRLVAPDPAVQDRSAGPDPVPELVLPPRGSAWRLLEERVPYSVYKDRKRYDSEQRKDYNTIETLPW